MDNRNHPPLPIAHRLTPPSLLRLIMYFQNDEDVSLPLPLPLDIQLYQDVGLWERSYSTVQELPGATDYSWIEQRHYGQDPLLGMGAEHSGTHQPQVPLDPFEPSQSSWVPQVPRDQSAVSVPALKRRSCTTDFCF